MPKLDQYDKFRAMEMQKAHEPYWLAVTLAGRLPSWTLRKKVEKIVKDVGSVRKLYAKSEDELVKLGFSNIQALRIFAQGKLAMAPRDKGYTVDYIPGEES